ncbi:MAG: hypothetical protein EPO68_13575 [Planctomycetota bacterium]|nr:MAG: hypothetical protein EPO68_13575 [Planctomycetota bacterium]
MTARLCTGLPSLRRAGTHALLLGSMRAGAERLGMRVVEFSFQSNHVHWIVEASDRNSLARGTKGLLVRLARQLNRHWGRSGRVFADRHHVRALQSPAEVRRALVYVLHNARRHGAGVRGIDPFSSGPWFDGFRTNGGNSRLVDALRREPRASCVPRTWLLRSGWQRRGRIDVDEFVPAWFDARAPGARSARAGSARTR